MRSEDIIRAWKDTSYRETLEVELPAHPAGMVELDDDELEAVAGGDLIFSVSVIVSMTVSILFTDVTYDPC